MRRVAVLDDYQGRAHEYADWASLGPDVEVTFLHDPIAPDQLPGALADYSILVLMRERTRFARAVLDQLPNLELVITTGMRNAAVDDTCLRERGVVYCGTEGIQYGEMMGVPSTAEVAWALIFAVLKRVPIEDAALRQGRWQLGVPRNLSGATLGLAGLGNLGSAMVAPAKAFGMSVIAWSEHLTPERAEQAGAARVTKADLLAASDVLSIHLVLSDRTRGLIGSDELAAMKSSAVLINTSRGPIVDEAALVAALRDGTIAGAGLDVFDTEPLPAGHSLTVLGNVVLLPHLGYVSEPAFRHMYGQAVENIAAFLAGQPVRTISAR